MAKYELQHKGKHYKISEDEQAILENGRHLNLRSMPFKVLLYLVANAEKWRTWQQIRAAVWPDTNVDKRNVHIQINAVRKIFGEGADDPEGLIETSGPRYRFRVAPQVSGEEGDEVKRGTAPGSSFGLSTNQAVRRLLEDYDIQLEGRQPQLDQLDNFLRDTSTSVLALISGSGTGKTALLAAWVRSLKSSGGSEVIFYPINHIYETDAAADTFSTLATELATLSDRPPAKADTLHQSRDLFANLLREWRSERTLVIVIDGLDEGVDWELARGAFPKTFLPNIKVVLSTCRTVDLTTESFLEQFGWDSGQVTFIEDLPPLDADAIAALVAPLQCQEPDLVHEIQRIASGEPIHVSLILKDLRDHALSLKEIRTLPIGLERYINSWLDRIKSEEERRKAQMISGLVTVSAGPLTYSDIHDLAPDIFESALEVRRTIKTIGHFLSGDGRSERGFTWNHSWTRNVFASWLSEHDKQTLDRRFADAGERWWSDRGNFSSDYFSKYWVHHLIVTRRWERVAQVLCSFEQSGDSLIQPWLAFQWNHTGSYEVYLRDLKRAAEDAMKQRLFSLTFLCVLIQVSINTRQSEYSPRLVADLVVYGNTHGKWTLNAALDVIQQFLLPQERAQALDLLVRKGVKFPINNIIEAVDCQWAYQKEAWLSRFNPYPPEALPRLLETARNQIYSADKARCFAAILPSVDQSNSKEVVREISEALAATKCTHCRFSVLMALSRNGGAGAQELISEEAKWLKANAPRGSIAAGFFQPQEEKQGKVPAERGKFLQKLKESAKTGFENCFMTAEQVVRSNVLSDSDLDDLVAIVRALPAPRKAPALAFLARIAPEHLKGTFWSECLQTLLTEPSELRCVGKIISSIPQAVLAQSWGQIAGQYSSLRLDDFEDIIPLIPEPFLDKTLNFIESKHLRRRADHQKVTSILALLGERFGGLKQRELLEKAQKSVESCGDADNILVFMKALLPYISAEAKSKVIEAYSRASSITKFVIFAVALKYCDDCDKETLWKRILDACDKISDISDKIEALVLLIDNAPHSFHEQLKTRCLNFPLNEDSCACWFRLLGELNRHQQEELFSFCMARNDLRGMISILRHLDQQSPSGIIDQRWSNIVSRLFEIEPVEKLVEQIAAVAKELPHGVLEEPQMDTLISALLNRPKMDHMHLSAIVPVVNLERIKLILHSDNWDDSHMWGEDKLLFTIAAARHHPGVSVDWKALFDRIERDEIVNGHSVMAGCADIVPEGLLSRVFRLATRRARGEGALDLLARRMGIETVCEFVNEARQERSREQRFEMYSCLLPRLSENAAYKRLGAEMQAEICMQFIEDCSSAEWSQWRRGSLLSKIAKIMPWFANVVGKDQLDSICLSTLEIVECWP